MREKKEIELALKDWKLLTKLLIAESNFKSVLAEVGRLKALLGIPIQADYVINEKDNKIVYFDDVAAEAS